MGFLLGAYGKLAAGSRYRSLQARMMRIQSRLRRATRDVANMEKMLDRNMKAELQSLTTGSNATKSMYQGIMQSAVLGGTGEGSVGYMQQKLSEYYSTGSGLTKEEATQYSNAISQATANYNTSVSQMTAWFDSNVAMTKQQIEEKYEMLRDTMLEPLKDEEDSLQLEKDTLESQIQVAKADYEACQKMEQADVKMLTPNYTGGQG